MILQILAAALREALADDATDNLDRTKAFVAECLGDLHADELDRALDALMTVAAVGQRLASARVGAR